MIKDLVDSIFQSLDNRSFFSSKWIKVSDLITDESILNVDYIREFKILQGSNGTYSVRAIMAGSEADDRLLFKGDYEHARAFFLDLSRKIGAEHISSLTESEAIEIFKKHQEPSERLPQKGEDKN